jgi:hypothetical protein
MYWVLQKYNEQVRVNCLCKLFGIYRLVTRFTTRECGGYDDGLNEKKTHRNAQVAPFH